MCSAELPIEAKPLLQVAVGVIENAAGQFLMNLRKPGGTLEHCWEFPGGKVDPGEGFIQALQRELWEELGLELDIPRHLQQAKGSLEFEQVHHINKKQMSISLGAPVFNAPVQVSDTVEHLITFNAQGSSRVIELAFFRITLNDMKYQPEQLSALYQERGKETQPLQWVSRKQMLTLDLPPPSYIIARYLQLYDRYWITPEPNALSLKHTAQWLLEQVEACPALPWLQLRAHSLSRKDFVTLCSWVLPELSAFGVSVSLNCTIERLKAVLASSPHNTVQGLHLTLKALFELSSEVSSVFTMNRALVSRYALLQGIVVGASCHSFEELQKAAGLGLDYASLSPIQPTKSHLGIEPLGWDRFAELVAQARLPVYGLGGLIEADLPKVISVGAKGIASLSTIPV